MQNPLVNTVKQELSQFGIVPDINTNGKHIKLTWKGRDGKTKIITTAKSTSDYRARLNIRSEVRKILRADGCTKENECPTPKPSILERAFEVPIPTDPLIERVSRLEQALEALTDLLIEIDVKLSASSTTISVTSDRRRSRNMSGSMSDVILSHLEFQFPKGPSMIATKIDRSTAYVSAYLNKLKQNGKVKNIGRGEWVKVNGNGTNATAI